MTEDFTYRNGEMFAEGVPVADLAERYGTPLYIYSRTHLRRQYERLRTALAGIDPLLCYSVKCNSNRGVLETFAELGVGADVVSGGELRRALDAGIPPDRIAFAGVGKQIDEIDQALQHDLFLFTVESEAELERLSERADALGRRARIAIRVTPDVDPKTHQYTTTGTLENKFGVDLERAAAAYRRAANLPGIEIAGLHMHLGSPLSDEEPYVRAIDKVTPLCEQLKADAPTFQHLDIGGGLGIPYRPDDAPFDLEAFRAALAPRLRNLGLHVSLEPGRFLAGNAGILVTRVIYVKDNAFKKFMIADASMTDLIRPPLYSAYHHVLPVHEHDATVRADLVGPVCESGDFIARDRDLPEAAAGDLLAVMSAGAYGFVMASNYNSRPRAAEVMVDGQRHALTRRRETFDDLVRLEQPPEWA